MANENKIKIIEAAEERFKNSPAIYFTNYTGMNVQQATELRKQFRDKNPKGSCFNMIRPAIQLPSPTLTQAGQQKCVSGVFHYAKNRKLTIKEEIKAFKERHAGFRNQALGRK